MAYLLLICLGALAWQPYAATAQALANQQRDSAGIRIVENARPEDGSRLGWRIGPRPAVSIGKVTGEEPYLLTGASDATRLSDGRIVVVRTRTANSWLLLAPTRARNEFTM